MNIKEEKVNKKGLNIAKNTNGANNINNNNYYYYYKGLFIIIIIMITRSYLRVQEMRCTAAFCIR